jgi:hypothetical protein
MREKENGMNDSGQDKVNAFDALFTNSQIQMLKIFMPYFDPSMQKQMAILIKVMELQYTIRFFQKFPYASPTAHETSFDMMKIAEELIPHSSPTDRPKLEGMRNMFRTMEQMKNMMEMMETMKELFPEGGGDLLSGFGGMAGMPGMGEMAAMSSLFGMGGEPDLESAEKKQEEGTSQMSQIMQMMQMMQMFQSMSEAGGEEAESKEKSSGVDE